jgi:hypothetical protein
MPMGGRGWFAERIPSRSGDFLIQSWTSFFCHQSLSCSTWAWGSHYDETRLSSVEFAKSLQTLSAKSIFLSAVTRRFTPIAMCALCPSGQADAAPSSPDALALAPAATSQCASDDPAPLPWPPRLSLLLFTPRPMWQSLAKLPRLACVLSRGDRSPCPNGRNCVKCSGQSYRFCPVRCSVWNMS